MRLASCKHGYHEWCCRFHFENSTKCVEEGCDEEMHDRWWSAVDLVKLGNPAGVFSTPRAIKNLPDSPLGSLNLPISSLSHLHCFELLVYLYGLLDLSLEFREN